MSSNLYPKLRWPIDVRMEEFDGQQVLVLRCPIGVSPGPLGLSPAVAPILSTLEGNISKQEILTKFSAQGLTAELLDELLTLLDTSFFLASPRFFAEERRIKESFSEQKVRPATRAGLVYSAGRQELAGEIDSYLAFGTPGPSDGEMVAFKAPHIDYRRGKLSYGKAYAKLTGRPEDIFILIGTSHQYSKGIFHLTAKDFDSPLGAVACDVETVTKLAARFGTQRAFADEFLHRDEHSLELQIPFIAKIRPQAKIVPILVGGFHRMISSQHLPEQDGEYTDFVGALAESVRDLGNQGRKVCVLAGVDMAHVGRAFGDEGQVTPEIMAAIAVRDGEYLAAIQKQDKRALFEHIASDGDARRICGFPTMYTVLDLFDLLNVRYAAELIEYRQAVDYRTDCAVTFAGMTFMKHDASSSSLI